MQCSNICSDKVICTSRLGEDSRCGRGCDDRLPGFAAAGTSTVMARVDDVVDELTDALRNLCESWVDSRGNTALREVCTCA